MQTNQDFQQLTQQAPPNLVAEFLQFLGHNKKWWLLPIVIVILLLGALVFLSNTAIAPFVYTLF